MRSSLVLLLTTAFLSSTALAQARGPSQHVERTIALSDGGWDLVSFDPVLRRLYIARPDAVTAIDVDSGRVTPRLAAADHSHAVVPLKNGTELLVTDGGTDTARFIDARSGAPLASVKVGQGPDAALYDAASGLAVVMNAKSGDLSLIDPATRRLVASIPVGGALELGAVDGQGRMYVNVEDKAQVAVVDLKTRKLVTRLALAGCEGPTGIAWLPVSHRVLSSCANGVAAVTDPAKGAVERLLPIGAGPDTVVYDATRALAFVPAGRSGELDVFADRAEGVASLGSAPTQRGARTGAEDEKTGRLYLPAAEYLPPAAAGGRPRPKPGSVVAVVVAP